MRLLIIICDQGRIEDGTKVDRHTRASTKKYRIHRFLLRYLLLYYHEKVIFVFSYYKK
jgi:hypothetical protein